MSTRKVHSPTVAAIVAALLLVGCGKDDPDRPHVPAGWARSYSVNFWSVGNSVRQTSDGGYIVAGWTGPNESTRDVLLFKASAAGDSLWSKAYDAPWAVAVSVLQTSDLGYLILAEYDGSSRDFWLVKTDVAGNVLWSQMKGYGDRDEVPSEVEPTSDGGYILVGTIDLGGGDFDLWMVKTGPDGETQWYGTKGYSSRQESGSSVQQTSDGGYLMAGTTYGTGTGYRDIWLVKTHANGSTHWNRFTSAGSNVRCGAIRRCSDGTYLVMADVPISEGQSIQLLKCDEAGNAPFALSAYEAWECRGGDAQQTQDGGFMIAGTTRPSSGSSRDFCLVKFSGPGGHPIWTRTFGPGDDVCNSGRQTSDGGYILCGSTSTPGVPECHLLLVKTDANGNID
jgi:hypothetical protein